MYGDLPYYEDIRAMKINLSTKIKYENHANPLHTLKINIHKTYILY